MMEEILAIYQGYLAEAEPDSKAAVAYNEIVTILQNSTDVLTIKNRLHAAELMSSTSEMQLIYQAARYRVERILWQR